MACQCLCIKLNIAKAIDGLDLLEEGKKPFRDFPKPLSDRTSFQELHLR